LTDNFEIAEEIENAIRFNAGILDDVMLKEGAVREAEPEQEE
jgi:hypothetical protein